MGGTIKFFILSFVDLEIHLFISFTELSLEKSSSLTYALNISSLVLMNSLFISFPSLIQIELFILSSTFLSALFNSQAYTYNTY